MVTKIEAVLTGGQNMKSAAGRAVVARFQWFQDTGVVGKIYQLPSCDQHYLIEFCDSWFSLPKIMTRCIRPYTKRNPPAGVTTLKLLLKHYLRNKVHMKCNPPAEVTTLK